MKLSEIKIGQMVKRKHALKPYIGEIVRIDYRGVVLLESYLDNCRHFINARFLEPLDLFVEPDEDSFHAYTPTLKGLHTCGDTKKEVLENAKDAVKAYIQSMVKHGEVSKNFACFRGGQQCDTQ